MKNESFRTNIVDILNSRRARYIIAGGWNTFFGYCSGVAMYYYLREYIHILVIAALSNVLAISMSFFVNKKFVFRTVGNWLVEYLKCYVVYGAMAVLGMVLLWIIVGHMHVNIFAAQGIVIFCTVFISYVGHEKFTFK